MQSLGADAVEGEAAMSRRNWAHRKTTVAIVYGTDGQPVAVLCDPEGDPAGQTWFTVVLDDSPGPDSEPDMPVCVDACSRLIRGSVAAWTWRSSIVAPSGRTACGCRLRSLWDE